MFYEFTQNNSGGSFDVDDKLCHRLIIEADSENQAIAKAEDLGVYFDGCEKGMDCSCCGDRWYSPSELKFPFEYSSFPKKEAQELAERYSSEIFEVKFKEGRTPWKDYKTGEPQDHGVRFLTPESYSQYLADNYGWCDPDVRIFYKGGTVVEITGKVYQK